MADLSLRNLSFIKQKDQHTGQALQDIQTAINNMAQQLNAQPVGVMPAPQPHSGLSVKGGAGVLDIAITDNTPQFRGKSNFADITNTLTGATHTVELGAGRNIRVPVGPGKFRVSSYGAYPTSGPSQAIHHDVVDTTGATVPAMQAGQGSGTGGGGYGKQPFNTVNVPKQ